MQIENMNQDRLYEFYFECFCSFTDMFKERLKYGREINRIMTAYKPIDAFRVATPTELVNRIFNSSLMHEWFAFRFWDEADKQVRNRAVDKNELFLALTFMSAIPTTKLMEEIFNEHKNGKCSRVETPAINTGAETVGVAAHA